MDDASVRLTMTIKSASGCVVESVTRAGEPSRSCPIGWHRQQLSACIADNRPANGWPTVALPSKPHLTAKIHPVCPIPLPCADGRNDDCSPYGAGLRPKPMARTVCGHPPSLPGTWGRCAVFCRWRHEVRESPGSPRVETADFAVGLASTRCQSLRGRSTQPRPTWKRGRAPGAPERSGACVARRRVSRARAGGLPDLP